MAKRILVADDSVTIQKAFAMVFGGHPDVALTVTRSLDEALASARQSPPDLVIADAALGNRTGYELAAALKAEPSLRSVPVYILASAQVPYDEARGRQSGAAGHLLKPFDSQILIDKVSEAMTGPMADQTADDLPTGGISLVAPASAPAKPLTDEDSYGEISIEHSEPALPAPRSRVPAVAPASVPAIAPVRVPAPAPAPAPASAPPAFAAPVAPRAAPPAFGAGLRPSLIPGAQPSLTARPALTRSPVTSVLPPSVAPPTAAPSAVALPAAPRLTNSRTIMGLPAASLPLPGSASRAPVAPALVPPVVAAPVSPFPEVGLDTPGPVSVTAAPAPPAPPIASPPLAAVPSAMPSAISSAVTQKVIELSARGPEYEAIARLSREIIEQIVWEIVPELAEVIIRQEVDRIAKK